jgi:hypothetical protein
MPVGHIAVFRRAEGTAEEQMFDPNRQIIIH